MRADATALEQALRPELERLDRTRHELRSATNRSRLVVTAVVVVAAGVILAVGFDTSSVIQSGFVVMLALVAGVVGLITFQVQQARRVAPWRQAFKAAIIGPVVRSFGDVTYAPDRGLTREDYDRSLLFSGDPGPATFASEDLVVGGSGSCRFRFADVVTTYLKSNDNVGPSENSSTPMVPLFRGLMLILDVGRPFDGATVVLARKPPPPPPRSSPPSRSGAVEKAVDVAGLVVESPVAAAALAVLWAASSRQRSDEPARPLVEVGLGDPGFAAVFDVTSSAPDEARALLTPRLRTLLQQLVAAAPALDADTEGGTDRVRITFLGASVHVAIRAAGDRFEPPSLDTDLLAPGMLAQHVADVRFALELARELTQSIGQAGAPHPPGA